MVIAIAAAVWCLSQACAAAAANAAKFSGAIEKMPSTAGDGRNTIGDNASFYRRGVE